MEQAELEYIEDLKEAPLKCLIHSIDHSSYHWHYEYEVLFILTGAVQITFEGGSRRLEKGDMILFNSREIHSNMHAEGENLCLALQWSPALFLEVYDAVFSFSLNTRSSSPPKPETISRLQRILAEMGLLLYKKPDGYQFAVKSCLYQFIALLVNQVPYKILPPDAINDPAVPPKSTVPGNTALSLEDFDRIKQYIKEHFRETVNINRLCTEVGMSRAKVFRILKAAGSDTIKGITNYYRVEYAKNLLRNSGLTVSYIASESGFESNSSFYRIFREAAGIPPHQYRETPTKSPAPLGIQGYADFPVPRMVKLLHEYYYNGQD
jgi:AraC-like DNA-binding protein